MILLMVPARANSQLQEIIPVRGNVVIFVAPNDGIEMNAVLNESARVISGAFNRLGRFLNVEMNQRDSAIEKAAEEKPADFYRRCAEILGVDLYIILSASRSGDMIISEMKVRSLTPWIKRLDSEILVRSRIAINIPYKLGVEAALLHRRLDLNVCVIGNGLDGTRILDAGQWHGIEKGTYRSMDGVTADVVEVGRFRSRAKISDNTRKEFRLPVYPEYHTPVDEFLSRIRLNTEFRYGLENTILKGSDPEKRLIEGTCVINTGANLCLPGYGSFLATRYMGFQKDSPDMAGVITSAGLILTHLTLAEFMAGFKINFFPGVNDGNKDKKIKNLQYFLWGSLPLTFSVSYFDQLAYQYKQEQYLPPFFRNKDEAAIVFSVIMPGGGLFYKGQRLAGWGYYFSEMLLAGYGVYNLENGKKWMYAFMGLGALKIIEIFNAYVISPAYDFYNNELEKGKVRAGISVGMDRNERNEGMGFIWTMGFTYAY